jgi:hypothetical protein
MFWDQMRLHRNLWFEKQCILKIMGGIPLESPHLNLFISISQCVYLPSNILVKFSSAYATVSLPNEFSLRMWRSVEFDVRILEHTVLCRFLLPAIYIPYEYCLGIKWMEILVADCCHKADHVYAYGQNRIRVFMDLLKWVYKYIGGHRSTNQVSLHLFSGFL